MTEDQKQALNIETPKTEKDAGRYSLNPKGEIFWQANATNPLPGVLVGTIQKGDSALSPVAKSSSDKAVDELQTWLNVHVRDVLAPIFALKETEGEGQLSGAAAQIGDALYDNMGVIHRSEIEQFVPGLTPELRGPIRRKRIKMGPILVFLMDLMKPAAVNLRALLWALWHGKDLPMETPADGRVSVTVDTDTVDRHFYRSIGYPVFGNKAIRIDMLDRVVTDIYDSAKEWQFQAKHQYAEWLGCNIEDLYGVLSSMGHIKVEVTAPIEQAEQSAAPMENDVVDAENVKPAVEVKPELAFFKLKKGKISTRPGTHKTAQANKPKPYFKKKFKKNDKPKNTGAKTFTAKPKAKEMDENNPFAILQQLKSK
jgi:ATP-dependent RNA helicase SUPV3L1/SUV3